MAGGVLAAMLMATGTPAGAETCTAAIADASAPEGSGEPLTFEVTRSSTSCTERFTYFTADGTAAAIDYGGSRGFTPTVVFPADSLTTTVRVFPRDDAVDEPDEWFLVHLSSSSGAWSFSDGEAVGTILDDDPPPVISITDSATTEGNSASFTVALSGASQDTVYVDYTTRGLTATAGADYAPKSGMLSFPPSLFPARPNIITLSTFDDNLSEGDETFAVVLSNAMNGVIGDGDALGRIVDEPPGYWMVASDGGIFSFGSAPFLGSTGDLRLNSPIVDMAQAAGTTGYWLVAADGGVFAFGDARFHGSTGGQKLNQLIVAMERTVGGSGYWLVASDGGIFAFGDARFLGSTGGTRLNAPIVGMERTPSGNGYWLLASDGGIFAFGDARFLGSAGAIRLNSPVTDVAVTATGGGYWMVAQDGGLFAFGDGQFLGSMGGTKLNRPVVGMEPFVHTPRRAPFRG